MRDDQPRGTSDPILDRLNRRFDRIDLELSAAKTRDEELTRLVNEDFEFDRTLGELFERKAGSIERKQDEAIALLKELLADLSDN